MGIAFDIIGALGFVLSLTLAIIEIVRNRRRLSLSDASFLYVKNRLFSWILLNVNIANQSSLPISVTGVELYSADGRLCDLMEYSDPFITFKESQHNTEAFTPTSFPVDLSPFSSQQARIALIPTPESLARLHLPEPDTLSDTFSTPEDEREHIPHPQVDLSAYRKCQFHLRLSTSRGPVDLVCVAKRKPLSRLFLSLTNNVPFCYPSEKRRV